MAKKHKPQRKQSPSVKTLSLREKLKQLVKKAEKNHRDQGTFDFESYEKSDSFKKYLSDKANPKCLTRGDIIELANRRTCHSNLCHSAADHLETCKACRSELLDWVVFSIRVAEI